MIEEETYVPLRAGDVVFPRVAKGIEMAAVPLDGKPGQKRATRYVLKHKGVVVRTRTFGGGGSAEFLECLVQSAGRDGWTTSGALVRASNADEAAAERARRSR